MSETDSPKRAAPQVHSTPKNCDSDSTPDSSQSGAVGSATTSFGGRLGCPRGQVVLRYIVRRAGSDNSAVMSLNHSMTSLCSGMPFWRRSASSSCSDTPG